jgi:hypothetical protein
MGKEKRLPDRLPKEYERDFPHLNDYVITSWNVVTYNCIAFAAGDTTRWWEALVVPEPGFYWPPDALSGEDNGDIEALKRCFAALEYEECGDGELEPGYKKVALYAIEKESYEHVAIQEANGHWSSKLGDGFDVRHKTAECVCGPRYGKIMGYMKRKTLKAN